jgi:hypothetical protein
MDAKKRYADIVKIKAFDVAEQVIALNTALHRFFESSPYNKSEITEVLSNIETSKWIEGLYEWVCEGKTIETVRLAGFVRELLKK